MWRPAIIQKAEAAVLEEKAAKLRGLAQVLDDQLGESFDAHLVAAGFAPHAAPAIRFDRLAQALRPLTDRLAAAFPNVGLGYYDAALDRIIAYGPSEQLGYLVGVVPPPDHLGRVAMARRSVRIAIGSMVRGDAMNCMHPIIRGDRVIGFAFANESMEDIYRQIQLGPSRSGQGMELATTLGLSSLAVFAGTSALAASAIRERLTGAVDRGLIDQASVVPLTSALRQVERYLRLFLNNVGTGLAIVDQGDQVLFCNDRLSRLCGEPEVQGQPWSGITAAMRLRVDPAESEGPPAEQRTMRATIAPNGGDEVAIELLEADLPGLPGHRLYLFQEADRARREGDYFERAERLALAGELATAIAHEIRNPLTVVAGSIQLIPDRLQDQEFLLSLSRIAGEELSRVNRIIQGLLGFARYSEPERKLIDLNQLILRAVEFLNWYATKRDVEVVLDLAPGELTVNGDSEHIRQALLNLMMNGIQAMEEVGGVLTIRTDQPAGSRSVRIFIEDEGTGIPEDKLAQMWEVFHSSKAGGSGLGLPVVHRIIDAHRGYIEVESTVGKGTCFTVLLPVANRHNLGEEGEGHG